MENVLREQLHVSMIVTLLLMIRFVIHQMSMTVNVQSQTFTSYFPTKPHTMLTKDILKENSMQRQALSSLRIPRFCPLWTQGLKLNLVWILYSSLSRLVRIIMQPKFYKKDASPKKILNLSTILCITFLVSVLRSIMFNWKIKFFQFSKAVQITNQGWLNKRRLRNLAVGIDLQLDGILLAKVRVSLDNLLMML